MPECLPLVLKLKICVNVFIRDLICDRLFRFSDFICNLVSVGLVICVIYFRSGLHVFVNKGISVYALELSNGGQFRELRRFCLV